MLFFDCDGVILDSNEIKSSAFYSVAKNFCDEKMAHAFMEYHQKNGGISRFHKFEYLFIGMLNRTDYQEDLNKALNLYADTVYSELLKCPLIDGVEKFLKETHGAKKYVVSGGKQTELEAVFKDRGLDVYFDGICGSPRDKFQILNDLGLSVGSENQGTYFGDSRLDYEVANKFGLGFVFIHGKSEFKDWKNYFRDKQITLARDFSEINSNTFSI